MSRKANPFPKGNHAPAGTLIWTASGTFRLLIYIAPQNTTIHKRIHFSFAYRSLPVGLRRIGAIASLSLWMEYLGLSTSLAIATRTAPATTTSTSQVFWASDWSHEPTDRRTEILSTVFGSYIVPLCI